MVQHPGPPPLSGPERGPESFPGIPQNTSTESWNNIFGITRRIENYLSDSSPTDLDKFVEDGDNVLISVTELHLGLLEVTSVDYALRPSAYPESFDANFRSRNMYYNTADTMLGLILSLANNDRVATITRKTIDTNAVFGNPDEWLTGGPIKAGYSGVYNFAELLIAASDSRSSLKYTDVEEVANGWLAKIAPMEDILQLDSDERRKLRTGVTRIEYRDLVHDALLRLPEETRQAAAVSLAIRDVAVRAQKTAYGLGHRSTQRNAFRSGLDGIDTLLKAHPDFNPYVEPKADPREYIKTFQAQKLDWPVLPYGKLREKAEEIVRQVRERYPTTKVDIDLDRLTMLEIIRTSWTHGKTEYKVGSLTGRRIVRRGAKECPDEYIVLVLTKDADSNGEKQTFIVAESPVSGRNITLIYRTDINGRPWEEVLSIEKDLALLYQARGLQHRKRGGILTPEITAQRVNAFLNATREEFINGWLDGDSIRIRTTRRLGNVALSFAEPTHGTQSE